MRYEPKDNEEEERLERIRERLLHAQRLAARYGFEHWRKTGELKLKEEETKCPPTPLQKVK